MEPDRMFARVARYHDAIAAARLEGLTWRELAAILAQATGVQNERRLADAFKRAARSIEAGRLSPKQLPLPGRAGAPSSRGEQHAAPAVEGASRPLPGDPSRRRMPADADEARAELERKGIVFR